VIFVGERERGWNPVPLQKEPKLLGGGREPTPPKDDLPTEGGGERKGGGLLGKRVVHGEKNEQKNYVSLREKRNNPQEQDKLLLTDCPLSGNKTGKGIRPG